MLKENSGWIYPLKKKIIWGVSGLCAASVAFAMIFIVIPLRNSLLHDSMIETQKLGDVVKSNLKGMMLKRDPSMLHQTFHELKENSSIVKAFIVDKNGRIAFSTETNEIGTMFDRHREESCKACHSHQRMDTRLKETATIMMKTSSGIKVQRNITAIYNEEACWGCHSKSDRINGKLIIDRSLEHTYSLIVKSALYVAGSGIACLIFLVPFLSRKLNRYITEIVAKNSKVKEAEWSYAMDFVEDAIYLIGLDDRVLCANRPFYEMTGLSPDQVVGNNIVALLHPEGELTPCPVCQARRDKRDAIITLKADHPDNPLGRPIEVMVKMIRDESGEPLNVLMGIHDLSGLEQTRKAEEERLRLQSQLVQAQKMESVGRLAGGVAHDFNNLLTGILGYTDLALKSVSDDHPVKEMLHTIMDSSQKASILIKQLLAFSRKQVLDMKVVSLNAVVEKMAGMLKRIIEENIVLELRIKTPIRNIMADSAQIEQVLMNLVINARDAMPDGGHLIIETSETTLDGDYCRSHEGADPGDYIMLSLTDTGQGMSPAVKENIFEPFFTTKEIGRGTGLGLSMAYGIVKQHNGHIRVYSEVGKGTTFSIYLPAVQGEVEMKEGNRKEDGEMPGGTETVMVCDDDPSILRLIVYVLKFLGYHVLQASTGEEALKISHDFNKNIDLLLTDVVMPGMNGKELADAFLAAHPEAKLIFISGYTDDVIARHGVLEPGMEFLQKPITPAILARKVRDVLDRKA